ncbi:type II toxin-antitoxin system RelE/ParE family toxin [Rhodopseudomonas sp. HC1]|uniref:type II toxin-antitoxin system RelE/ParE family toxin n=1 Tax=Rhodopseudomonas infernalis TaxID=2897386 RepID=UPI001EE940B8|nr:type II toxin-antitoxin system RelE/ParE family toxin [Rhodopseudomonas infernalis]MCG6207318.1 type II toxin-antitoxin system RelE/ParE family toxin [Rhodopseudomonas infernalis]
MIRSFKAGWTEAVFNGECPKGFPAELKRTAFRKLRMIDAATCLDDLKAPPGNKLHPLSDDRSGQHAIWINDKYRVCFEWSDEGPAEVEIVDYHQ